ncbi:MAG TPA: pyrroline-5-carboxylate reductase dimerization domain-containing protein [Solirubrobacteraceae bacterium]|nr:pyrroline-5-carboxylate reductase dimerization domain-containing protein [Solirubrobacteraceae bacterium]
MKVGLIGSGNMARALARGWGEPVLCSDSGSGRAQALALELGGRAASNLEVAREADLVVLCHKPYQLKAVAAEIAGEAKAVVSILGATTLRDLRQAYPGVPVFRIEPNTPVEVRRGVLLWADGGMDAAAAAATAAASAATARGNRVVAGSAAADPVTTEEAEQAAADAKEALDEQFLYEEVLALFEQIGWVAHVPERLLGAAAAVSAVGPAYLALLAEAWSDAAIRHGLSPEVASGLTIATMAGTADLLAIRDGDTLAVRREVTSPGGSTARGLDALERAGLRTAFADAMDAVDRTQR